MDNNSNKVNLQHAFIYRSKQMYMDVAEKEKYITFLSGTQKPRDVVSY
jgi:ribosome-associated toxin RatA of RatAB toxin-antitoxin module